MEQLAHRWAQKIGTTLGTDEERIAVMAYGLTALLQLVLIFLAAALLGWALGFFGESMIVFFSVGFLRRLIGGAHAGSFNGCLVVSIFCIGFFSALAHYVLPLCPFWVLCGASLAIYLTAVVLIARLAPVDSPNKPVRSLEKRRRLRRSAFGVMVVFALLTAAALLWQIRGGNCARYIWALNLSVLWQTTMLTGCGSRLIRIVDLRFKRPL